MAIGTARWKPDSEVDPGEHPGGDREHKVDADVGPDHLDHPIRDTAGALAPVPTQPDRASLDHPAPFEE